VFGSLAGGALLDWLGATMLRGMLLSAACMAVGLVLVLVTVLAAHSQAALWTPFSLAEFAVFAVQVGGRGPQTEAVLWGGQPALPLAEP